VSRAQTLAKLQSLLSRVRSRAAEPRPLAGGQNGSTRRVAAGATESVVAPLAAERAAESPAAEARLSAVGATTAAAPVHAAFSSSMGADEAAASEWIAEPTTLEDGVDVSVEMSTWTPPALGTTGDIEVDVEVDIEISEPILLDSAAEPVDESVAVGESPVPAASESAERLVAAQPVAGDPAGDFAPTAPIERVEPMGPMAPSEAVAELAPAVGSALAAEVAEAVALALEPRDSVVPVPPIAASELRLPPLSEVEASLELEAPAIAEDVGKVVELPPASSRRPLEPEDHLAEMAFGTGAPQPPRHTPPPESGRLPAAPPDEFDADVTGVRDAVTLARTNENAPVAPALPPPMVAFVPQSARPVLGGSGTVADVVGDAQRFTPATFAALLDATLAL
jgi:hypothetical protein